MNKDVTEQLGGLQQVTGGLIMPGDKVTFTFDGERCIEPVEGAPELIGMVVPMAEALYELTVYRAIPVAKQGDIDHPQETGLPEWVWLPSPESQNNPEKARLPGHFIPQDSTTRKGSPMYSGLLGYFPAALFEVAVHSRESNDKHNPGQELHWSRGKSDDHAECIMRHLVDSGDSTTPDRLKHLRALAWRALALLQEECEHQGAKPGISSKFDGHG